MPPAWTHRLDDHEREEIAAQRVACSVLLHGCEVALSGFRSLQGRRSEDAARARVEAILEGILFSWQETLDLLEAVSPRPEGPYPREVLRAINAR